MGMWEGVWAYSNSVHWGGGEGKEEGERVEGRGVRGETRGRLGALGVGGVPGVTWVRMGGWLLLGSGPIRQAQGRLDAGVTGMCSVGGVNVFSFGGDVFTLEGNVSTLAGNVSSLGGAPWLGMGHGKKSRFLGSAALRSE